MFLIISRLLKFAFKLNETIDKIKILVSCQSNIKISLNPKFPNRSIQYYKNFEKRVFGLITKNFQYNLKKINILQIKNVAQIVSSLLIEFTYSYSIFVHNYGYFWFLDLNSFGIL